jgi:Metal binding domain of Ada
MPPAPPPRAVNPNIPSALDRICQRALAHNPADRYPDAQSMLDDLDRWLERRRTRKRRLYVRTGMAALLLLSALGIYSSGFSTKGAEQTTLANSVLDPVAATTSGPLEAPAPTPAPAAAATVASRTTPSAEAPPVSVALGTFLGNRSSKVYHRAGCGTAASMLARHRVEFASSADAQAQGYTPCRSCQPDRDPSSGAQTSKAADGP